MPPRGKRAAADGETATESKRYKSAIDAMADEFVCPITQELPVEPVMAQDGRIYEKAAIEDWFVKKQGQPIKSPVTNEPMGRTLIASTQARNAIRNMVESGALSGAKADAWKERMEGEAKVAELRRKAEAGDADAMNKLYFVYRDAQYGVSKDLTQAFQWVKRAADLEDVDGLRQLACCYLYGRGTAKNESRGMVTFSQAAVLGSEFACYVLGLAYYEGFQGFDEDSQEAARWLRKMPGCSEKDGRHARDDAADMLSTLA